MIDAPFSRHRPEYRPDAWGYAWRRLHSLNATRHLLEPDRYLGDRADLWMDDMGYCIDRYSIERNDQVVVCRP